MGTSARKNGLPGSVAVLWLFQVGLGVNLVYFFFIVSSEFVIFRLVLLCMKMPRPGTQQFGNDCYCRKCIGKVGA